MLHLVHRVTISIKSQPVKLEQAVSESLPHKSLVWIQFQLRYACAMCKITIYDVKHMELGELSEPL